MRGTHLREIQVQVHGANGAQHDQRDIDRALRQFKRTRRQHRRTLR